MNIKVTGNYTDGKKVVFTQDTYVDSAGLIDDDSDRAVRFLGCCLPCRYVNDYQEACPVLVGFSDPYSTEPIIKVWTEKRSFEDAYGRFSHIRDFSYVHSFADQLWSTLPHDLQRACFACNAEVAVKVEVDNEPPLDPIRFTKSVNSSWDLARVFEDADLTRVVQLDGIVMLADMTSATWSSYEVARAKKFLDLDIPT